MESKLPYYAETVSNSRCTTLDPRLGGRAIKSSKFTNTIVRHGLWRDTSITAATREKKKHDTILKRKHGTMDRLSAQFEREAHRIAHLQKMLAESQQDMARIAMEKYTATYIQSIVRGWLGKLRWKVLFFRRLLGAWIMFRLYFRRRRAAWRLIRTAISRYILLKRLSSIGHLMSAVRKIQAAYHRRYLVKRAVITVKVMQMWNDVKHLGMSRVRLRLCQEARSKLAVNKLMRGFVRRQRLRRLGNPQGCNRIFYSLFFCQKDELRSLNSQERSGGVVIEEGGEDNDEEEDTCRPLKLALSPQHVEYQASLFRGVKISTDTFRFIKSQSVSKRLALLNSAPPAARKKTFLTKSNSAPMPSRSKPPRVSLHRRADSQLDAVSILKNEFKAGNRKNIPTPYVLRDTFRIRSMYDAVTFMQDLIARAAETPELVGETLELQSGTVENFSVGSPKASWKTNRVRAMSIKPFGGLLQEFTKATASPRAIAGGAGRRVSRVAVPAANTARRPSVAGAKGLALQASAAALERRKQSLFGRGSVVNSSIATAPLKRVPRKGSLTPVMPPLMETTPSLPTTLNVHGNTPDVTVDEDRDSAAVHPMTEESPTRGVTTNPQVPEEPPVCALPVKVSLCPPEISPQAVAPLSGTGGRPSEIVTVTITDNIDVSSCSDGSGCYPATLAAASVVLPDSIRSSRESSFLQDNFHLSNQEEVDSIVVKGSISTLRAHSEICTMVEDVGCGDLEMNEDFDNDGYDDDCEVYEDDFEELDEEPRPPSTATPRRPSEPKPSALFARTQRPTAIQ